MKHGTFTRGLTIAQQQEIKPIADANNVWTGITFACNKNYYKYTMFMYSETDDEWCLHSHDCCIDKSDRTEVTPEEFVRQFKEHFAQPVSKKVQELERELADTKAELEKLKAKRLGKPSYMDFNGFAVHEDGSITKNGIWLYENGDGDTLNSRNAIWVSGDSKWQPVLEQNPNGNWAFYIKKKD